MLLQRRMINRISFLQHDGGWGRDGNYICAMLSISGTRWFLSYIFLGLIEATERAQTSLSLSLLLPFTCGITNKSPQVLSID